MKTILIVATVTPFLFAACDQSPDNRSHINELQLTVNELQQKIATLDDNATKRDELNSMIFKRTGENVKRIDGSLRFITDHVLKIEFTAKPAIIDPSGKGYATLDSGKGILLISCDYAESYLDGHRLKLQIGNPLSMTFLGFKLTFSTGRRPPEMPTKENTENGNLGTAFNKWGEDMKSWRKSLKKHEETFSDDLNAGAWTIIEATLPQTKPEEIAYIEVIIETNQVRLTSPK